MFMATALAAVSLVACGEKNEPAPARPSIALEGLDITQVHEITGDPMTVKVNVAAEAGIKTFAIRISSPLLTEELLGAIGLSTEMELTEPAFGRHVGGALESGFPRRGRGDGGNAALVRHIGVHTPYQAALQRA